MEADEATERRLIQDAAAGDAVAFEALVHAHGGVVRTIAGMQLRDRGLADDVTQDVFVRLLQSLPRFRHEARLRTWLVRVTLNRCADVRRRQGRDVQRSGVHPPSGDEPDLRPSAEARAVERSRRERLREAIGRLPDDLRVLVSLRYDAELEYAEIARTLSLPIGTVATRMARAMRTLRRMLDPDSQGHMS